MVNDMPHVVITTPLACILGILLWSNYLDNKREGYIKEQSNLKGKMDEQEKIIRETINPALYNTFRRIILKDE